MLFGILRVVCVLRGKGLAHINKADLKRRFREQQREENRRRPWWQR
jgi:hypothetical protein